MGLISYHIIEKLSCHLDVPRLKPEVTGTLLNFPSSKTNYFMISKLGAVNLFDFIFLNN